MKQRSGRREFVKELAATGLACSPLVETMARVQDRAPRQQDGAYDLAVIGAGVFGVWTAHHAREAGLQVLLVDAYGPGNSRASSGGESRVIRMGYGSDEIYTRWSLRSLELWKTFFERTGQPLFHQTGVLWIAREKDAYAEQSLATLRRLNVPCERLKETDLERRFPQIRFDAASWGILEPQSGVLLARRAVQAVMKDAVRSGLAYRTETIAPPRGGGRLGFVETSLGEKIRAGKFVFCCGPWLPKIFPEFLKDRIHPTRQEVLFFGPPAGEPRFSPPSMPAWIDFANEIYGIPDLESRGFKIAPDRHGARFDPDSGERTVAAETIRVVRKYLAARFPLLQGAPLLESRVCQYENTSNGDFLIDRHPGFENVWLVGGGSGHGFKHGPALGEYTAARIRDEAPVESRFSLATKKTVQKRSVF